MRYSALLLQLSLGVLTYVSCTEAVDVSKDKRQVGQTVAGQLDTDEDRDTAASGFASAGIGQGKYFQYAHVPAKDHYEFGHRRGNEHHFIERHEKAHPHAGEFKTKVRWGDKHGGYGEHYWDYNHDGHDHGHDGEESEQKPQYAAYTGAATETNNAAKYLPARAKRQPANAPDQDVEFIDDTARFLSEAGLMQKHGGNYRWEPSSERAKRTPVEIRDLAYDTVSRQIIDRKTGNAYTLTPVV